VFAFFVYSLLKKATIVSLWWGARDNVPIVFVSRTMPTVFLLPLAFEPWCHECSSNDYDDDFDVPPVCHPAPMLSPRSSMARPSSPSSVTRFPTKCGVSGSPPKERNSRKHLRDMSDPLAPLFLLDAFKAEQESSSSEETNNNKAVRFAYPLVSSVRECPPRQSSKKEKEILFYTASDIRRFKKERRQINFLCRMAGCWHKRNSCLRYHIGTW
jgi:hypothetical protein